MVNRHSIRQRGSVLRFLPALDCLAAILPVGRGIFRDPFANRSRSNSRILRIDSLSAGIPVPRVLAKGASLPSVDYCQRRGPLDRHASPITIAECGDHDRPVSVISFHRVDDHVPPESVITIDRNTYIATAKPLHIEQGEGSMPVAGTPQKAPAGYWIFRANPTS